MYHIDILVLSEVHREEVRGNKDTSLMNLSKILAHIFSQKYNNSLESKEAQREAPDAS